MAQTVIGFFDEQSDAQRAIEQLQSRGFSRDRVDISRCDTASQNVGYDTRNTREREDRSGNAVTNFFNNLFGNDNDEADRYSRVAQNCNSIVTVHAQSEDEAERAADILDDCGALNVDERASQMGYTNTRNAGPGARQDVSDDRGTSIPIIEENLEVGKRTVERGGVRVRSRIVERPVEEHVRLREEHVHVERENVNRPATEADFARAANQNIEMRERSEEAVANKQSRVVEEVRVSKNIDERDETVRDTVRKTDVDVDKLDSTNRRSDTDINPNLDDPTRRNRNL